MFPSCYTRACWAPALPSSQQAGDTLLWPLSSISGEVWSSLLSHTGPIPPDHKAELHAGGDLCFLKSKWTKSFQLSKCSHLSRLKGADFRSVPLSLYFIHWQNLLRFWSVSHLCLTWLWGVLEPPWDTGSVSSGAQSPALHAHQMFFSAGNFSPSFWAV